MARSLLSVDYPLSRISGHMGDEDDDTEGSILHYTMKTRKSDMTMMTRPLVESGWHHRWRAQRSGAARLRLRYQRTGPGCSCCCCGRCGVPLRVLLTRLLLMRTTTVAGRFPIGNSATRTTATYSDDDNGSKTLICSSVRG
jgi:hypothetical protein